MKTNLFLIKSKLLRYEQRSLNISPGNCLIVTKFSTVVDDQFSSSHVKSTQRFISAFVNRKFSANTKISYQFSRRKCCNYTAIAFIIIANLFSILFILFNNGILVILYYFYDYAPIILKLIGVVNFIIKIGADAVLLHVTDFE